MNYLQIVFFLFRPLNKFLNTYIYIKFITKPLDLQSSSFTILIVTQKYAITNTPLILKKNIVGLGVPKNCKDLVSLYKYQ